MFRPIDNFNYTFNHIDEPDFIEETRVYVAYILEDNTIEHDFDEKDAVPYTTYFDDKKVVGYVIIDNYEDADEDDILAAFKYGYHDIKDYFEDLRDMEDYINDPYIYNGVSRSDF